MGNYTIDTSKYTGEPKHCCLMMDMMLDEGYLSPTISWLSSTKYPPHFEGPRLTEHGRKHKPSMLINYCPWCGKKLVEDAPNAAQSEAEAAHG